MNDFCTKFSGSISAPSISNTQSYAPILGNSDVIFSVDYNNDDACPQDGDDAQYPFDQAACARFLQLTLDDCDTTFTGSDGKYGGNVTDACGVFSMTTQITEKALCGYNPLSNPVAMQYNDAVAAINDYCSKDLYLDPSFEDDGSFYQTPQDGMSYDDYTQGLNGYVIETKAFFNSQYQDDCLPAKRFGTQGDECKRKLTAVLNNCETRPFAGFTPKLMHK